MEIFSCGILLYVVVSPFLLFSWHKRCTLAENALAATRKQLEEEGRRTQQIAQQLTSENSSRQRSIEELTRNLAAVRRDLTSEHEKTRQALRELAKKYVKDTLKFVIAGLTANNYESSRRKLERVFEICSKHGAPQENEKELLKELRDSFEEEVRKAEARLEQQRIKEKIREEQREERLREEETRRLERDQKAIELQLAKALKEAKDQHNAEVERLQQLLAEAQARSERAKSMAQLTKAGFVYVVSNIGSFGENVFKVGMTRRLEPMDRIRELGDASVPFPFDVHMMINCEDAPALETKLHQELHATRLNKINLRKEFFKTDIETIRTIAESSHGKIEYIAQPEAFEYRESLLINERGFNAAYDPSQESDDDDESFAA